MRFELFKSMKSSKLSSLNPILGNDVIDSEEESPSIFEENPTQKKPDSEKAEFLTLNRSRLSPLYFYDDRVCKLFCCEGCWMKE